MPIISTLRLGANGGNNYFWYLFLHPLTYTYLFLLYLKLGEPYFYAEIRAGPHTIYLPRVAEHLNGQQTESITIFMYKKHLLGNLWIFNKIV